MSLPTDYDRQLWLKATQNPGQITNQERRHILQLADPLEQLANALQTSGLTPEELENKVLTNADSLTDAECTLIRHGYHHWDLQERIANSQMDWPTKDKMARIHAVVALRTPHDNAVNMALTRRTVVLADEKDQARKVTMAKVAEELQTPCKWVRKIIDSSVPNTEQTKRWGYVVLRDARTACSEEAWEIFLKQLDDYIDSSMAFLAGSATIKPTKQLIWQNGFVDKNDWEGIISAYQEIARLDDTNEHILSNTFLLVTPDVVASFIGDGPHMPWIWAYEANFIVPEIAAGDGKYDGRLKVSLYSLFTWFYAARKENIYSMELFWKKAQQQPGQAWVVGTTMGRYHGPLVLLDKGTLWPFNTYELENKA